MKSKKRPVLRTVLHARVAVVLCASGLIASPSYACDPLSVQDEYIVVFEKTATAPEIDAAFAEAAQLNGGPFKRHFSHALKGLVLRGGETAVSAFARKHAAVLRTEKNACVSIQGYQANSQAVGSSAVRVGQVIPSGVVRVGGPLDGRGRNIWIIDTGVDLKNRDLNIGIGANFVNDRAGKLENSPQDGSGHGTHVAGIIAALNNGVNVVGVASGATVHPVRVLGNDGMGTIDTVLAGVDYVAANAKPGDVANMSLSAKGHFPSLHDAIVATADRGIFFGIAAGNAAASASEYEPAHIEHPNVFTASSVSDADVFSTFSNFGNPPIDFAAPGEAVLSLKLGGGVVAYSGTSMAAPHVSALLLFRVPRTSGYASADPDGTPDPVAGY